MDRKTQSNYENKLSDWMAIDAIVRQRDKEITASNIAKLSGKYEFLTHHNPNKHFKFSEKIAFI